MLRRQLLMLLLLACALPPSNVFAASALVTEMIPAGYRPVDEIVAILRPLVPRPGSISGAYGKIIIRTTPENMREIKEILATLDRAPANLLISVRHSMNEEVRRDLYEAFGEVSGANVSVSTGRDADSGGGLVIRNENAGVRIDKTEFTGSDGGTQRVRVLEGREAFIRSGQSVPINEERVVVSSSGVTTVKTSTGYRNVGSGFYARARMNGDDRVTVEIFPQHNRLNSGSRSIDVREASTVVSSRLGRWVEIGRLSSTASDNTRAIGASSNTTTSSHYATYLKVDRLDR